MEVIKFHYFVGIVPDLFENDPIDFQGCHKRDNILKCVESDFDIENSCGDLFG